MPTLCLTAGPEPAEILFATGVLPLLRRLRPGWRLVWECPRPECRSWLEAFPELDGVIADAELLAPPPEDYLMIHPLWRGLWDHGAGEESLEAARPHRPPGMEGRPRPEGLPAAYICLDPRPGPEEPPEKSPRVPPALWTGLAGRSPLPLVQVGPPESPLLPGLLDGRRAEMLETAGILAHARLFLGGDSPSSYLAWALEVPRIWLVPEGSAWRLPRAGEGEDCLHLKAGGGEPPFDPAALSASIRSMLSRGRGSDGA